MAVINATGIYNRWFGRGKEGPVIPHPGYWDEPGRGGINLAWLDDIVSYVFPPRRPFGTVGKPGELPKREKQELYAGRLTYDGLQPVHDVERRLHAYPTEVLAV